MIKTPSDRILRAAVIGWPVAHSRSPVIHGHWLERYRVSGRYDLLAVEPQAIEATLRGFGETGLIGANVTVPYKQAAYDACEDVDAIGHALGALNTLWLKSGRLCGTNTDVHGFLANLDDQAPGWDARGGPAVVLGAGGAARAVVFALQQRRMTPIHVVNRTMERARALARAFSRRNGEIAVYGWSDVDRACRGGRFLVNTTSLGMTGQPELAVDLASLGDGAVVNDIVYAPLRTPLLRQARARAQRDVDGLGMLLHQAVPGFEKWFGVRPAVDEALRRRIRDDLVTGDNRLKDRSS